VRSVGLMLLGGAVGFLLAAFLGQDPLGIRKAGGGAGADDGDSPRRAAPRSHELATALEEARAAVERLEAENAKLREEAAAPAPGAEPGAPAAAPGTRLADGRILGGARWPDATVSMAVGFLDNILAAFLKEAKLSAGQETRVRAEYERSIGDAMQIIADVINDDMTPDQAYDRYAALTTQGLNSLRQILNEEQYAVFERFEKGTKDFVLNNVVAAEIASLRSRVGLDAEQAKSVAVIVRERYEAVGAKIAHPLPNMFFQPVRREADRAIYDDTSRRIRDVLSPNQVVAFEKVEADPMASLREFRKQLVAR